jgi:hypothetical protein
MERENLLRLMAASDQDANACRNIADELAQQSALADAGLAAQQHHASAGVEHIGQSIVQVTEFNPAADHWRFVGPGICEPR